MKTEIVDKNISELRTRLAKVLVNLLELLQRLKLDREVGVAREAFTMINSPFLFVVVGEVKAGKSSFINALLGETICKVDARPCTDVVQEIAYGEEEHVEVLGKHLKRITRPVELLKTIAIVDTPGTNTVIENHQLITESYIPHSDLVVFVFPAKNPHTKSAWDLLSFVKDEWRRKVVFVLQQADLEPEHLKVQMESVRAYAMQHGLAEPVIFATSATWELAGKANISGFESVREYIRTKVTGGLHLYEKIEGQAGTASRLCETAEKSVAALRTQLERDKELQRRIQSRLACGQGRSSKEVDALVDRLVTKYGSISDEFKKEFREGLEIGRIFKRILPGSESSRAWLEGLQKRFEERLSSKLEEIAKQEAEFFIDDVKNLMKELLNELDKITNPKDAFNAAEQMDRRRSEVTDGVKTKLRELTQNADAMLKAVSGSTENLPTTVAGGSAVAVIGTIIALGLKAAIFDITGGILTAIGFAIAGFAIIWKRGRIVEQFETGLDQGKQQLEDELKAKLAVSLRGVYHEIEIVFQAFFDYLKFREDELRPQITALEEAQAGLLEIAKQVKVVAEGSGPANKSKSVLLSRSPDKDQ